MNFELFDRHCDQSNSVHWSDDGLVAVLCKVAVYLYVPVWRNRRTEQKPFFHARVTCKDLSGKALLPPLSIDTAVPQSDPMAGLVDFKMLSGEFIKSAVWSPRGYARNGGCVLLILRCTNVGLIVDFSATVTDGCDAGKWDVVGELTSKSVDILSVDWSSSYADGSIIALGKADGTVTLLKANASDGQTHVALCVLLTAKVDEPDAWITRVCFGAQWVTGTTTLYAATSTGRLYAYELRSNYQGTISCKLVGTAFDTSGTAISGIAALYSNKLGSLDDAKCCGAVAISRGAKLFLVYRLEGQPLTVEEIGEGSNCGDYCAGLHFNHASQTLWLYSRHQSLITFKLSWLPSAQPRLSQDANGSPKTEILKALELYKRKGTSSKVRSEWYVRLVGLSTSLFQEFALVHCHFDLKGEHEYKTDKSTTSLFSVVMLKPPKHGGNSSPTVSAQTLSLYAGNRFLFDALYGSLQGFQLGSTQTAQKYTPEQDLVAALVDEWLHGPSLLTKRFSFYLLANRVSSDSDGLAAQLGEIRSELLLDVLERQAKSWNYFYTSGMGVYAREIERAGLCALVAASILKKSQLWRLVSDMVEYLCAKDASQVELRSLRSALEKNDVTHITYSETCHCGASIRFNNLYKSECARGHVHRRCNFSLLSLTRSNRYRCYNCDSVYLRDFDLTVNTPLAYWLKNLKVCVYCSTSLTCIGV